MNEALPRTTSAYRSGLSLIRDVLIWRKITIIAWASFALLVATFWIILQPSRYTARAELLLDTKPTMPAGDSQASSTVDASFVETQIETLKSDAIAASVIESQKLWNDPEFSGGGNVFGSLLSLFESSSASPKRAQREATLKTFKRWLNVRRAGRSYIVELSYSSLSPQRAAAIANSFAEAYLADLFQAKGANAQRANSWMLENSGKLREEESKAEQAVEDFKATDLQPSASYDPEALKQSRVRLRSLEAHAQAYRSVYEGFLSRTAQALPQQTFPVTDARVLGAAVPPERPNLPRWSITLLIAGVAGASAGFLSGFAKEHLHVTVRGPDSLEETGLPSLGAVPLVSGRSLVPRRSKFRPLYIGNQADGLHRAKLAIDSAFGDAGGSAIGITSAHSSEGKTTFAYNLAAFLAEQDPAALVDWNLRSPWLSEVIEPLADHGTTETGDTVTVNNAAHKHELGFVFIPALSNRPTANSSAVLSSPRARETLENARRSFRYTIVDLPSLEHVDACVAAPLLDAFIIVAEAGRNDAVGLRRTIWSAGVNTRRIIGVVINKA